jgi:Domain of unknown function (DUF5666)
MRGGYWGAGVGELSGGEDVDDAAGCGGINGGRETGLGEEHGMRAIGMRGKFNLGFARIISAAFVLVAFAATLSTKAMERVTTFASGTSVDARQAAAAPGQAGVQPIAQVVGTVKAIAGNVFTLTLDGGAEVLVTVSDATKIVQVAPGSKDLKAATPIALTDLAVGDRILVRHRSGADAKAVAAVGIIAMKSGDVAAKQAQDRGDWLAHGVGGLVKSVDAAAGTITISAPAVAGVSKTIVIHTTSGTILRRYAPDSVKFDAAKAAPIAQIQAGDQLRARGEKSADGNEFTAAEIVSGTFRNIAGTINSVDASAKTISMTDLITKKAVVVKVSDETQLKKLPPEMATRIAMRLRGGGAAGAGDGGSGASANNSASGGSRPAGGAGGSGAGGDASSGGPGGGGMRAGGGGGRSDFQTIVSRLPAAALGDFSKGDAVLVVSTQGTDAGGVTAITLVGGVEAIMAAAPGGGAAAQAALLSPWNLGGGAPGGGDQ